MWGETIKVTNYYDICCDDIIIMMIKKNEIKLNDDNHNYGNDGNQVNCS